MRKVLAGGWDRSSSEFTFSDLTGDSGWVRARPGNCWPGPSGLCGGSRWCGPSGWNECGEGHGREESPEVGESAGDGLDESAGPGPAVQRAAEEDDLRESLAGLSRLTNRLGLEDLLTRVATYAVRAIPGADGAGLTLLEDDRANTIVATAAFVSEIDDIQYGIGQGPCITAARDGQTVMSGSLGSDPRWRSSVARSPGWVCTACCRYRWSSPTGWSGR